MSVFLTLVVFTDPKAYPSPLTLPDNGMSAAEIKCSWSPLIPILKGNIQSTNAHKKHTTAS